jgi:hypothetical protein
MRKGSYIPTTIVLLLMVAVFVYFLYLGMTQHQFVSTIPQ